MDKVRKIAQPQHKDALGRLKDATHNYLQGKPGPGRPDAIRRWTKQQGALQLKELISKAKDFLSQRQQFYEESYQSLNIELLLQIEMTTATDATENDKNRLPSDKTHP